jgi:hypothetical protein
LICWGTFPSSVIVGVVLVWFPETGLKSLLQADNIIAASNVRDTSSIPIVAHKSPASFGFEKEETGHARDPIVRSMVASSSACLVPFS